MGRVRRGKINKLSDLSAAALEHMNTLRFDRFLEKDEGPVGGPPSPPIFAARRLKAVLGTRRASPRATPALPTCSRGVHLIEALENARAVLRWNSRPGVLNANRRHVVGAGCGKPNLPAGGRKLQRIVDHVSDDTARLFRVSYHP